MRVNRIILLILFVGLFGCKSKHVITENSDRDSSFTESLTQVDSIAIYESIKRRRTEKDSSFIKRIITAPQIVTIEDPCDSLTGLLRKFELQSGKTNVKSDGQRISVNTAADTCDRYYQKKISELNDSIMALKKYNELAEKVTGIVVNNNSSIKDEKTGVVGWLEKLGITLAAIAYVSIFWLVVFIILWFSGKVELNL